MPLVCKWKTTCFNCGTLIDEGDKKQEHLTCWDCKVEQEKRDGKRCACGAWKKRP
jgi:hypothetical protein